MDIFSLDKMYLVVIFLIPGFVCMKIYSAHTAGAPLDASKSMVDAIAWSCLIYAVCSPIIIWMQVSGIAETSPNFYTALWLILLFIAPVGLALGWAYARKHKWLLNLLPHPTGKAWDYVFSRREILYVIITLRTGKRIGGAYGANSFSSSGHHEEQIFIEEVWDVDDDQGFIKKHVRTRGMLISNSQIESIEFIGLYDENTENPNT